VEEWFVKKLWRQEGRRTRDIGLQGVEPAPCWGERRRYMVKGIGEYYRDLMRNIDKSSCKDFKRENPTARPNRRKLLDPPKTLSRGGSGQIKIKQPRRGLSIKIKEKKGSHIKLPSLRILVQKMKRGNWGTGYQGRDKGRIGERSLLGG